MWPSDQWLTGDMTYRGRGHIKVKEGLLSNAKSSKAKPHMTEQPHGNNTPKPKQNHGNSTAAKPSPPATAWDAKRHPFFIFLVLEPGRSESVCFGLFRSKLLTKHKFKAPTRPTTSNRLRGNKPFSLLPLLKKRCETQSHGLLR